MGTGLRLATQKLSDQEVRVGGDQGFEARIHRKLLGIRETGDGGIEDDVSTHRLLNHLCRLKRIRGQLREVDPEQPPRALTHIVGRRDGDQSVRTRIV